MTTVQLMIAISENGRTYAKPLTVALLAQFLLFWVGGFGIGQLLIGWGLLIHIIAIQLTVAGSVVVIILKAILGEVWHYATGV